MLTGYDKDHPANLIRQVARATGESPRLIHQRGFQLLRELPADGDCSADQLGLSCPGCGRDIRLPDPGDAAFPDWAECPRCDAAYPWHPQELRLLP